MTLGSDAIFDKIAARVAKVDANDRKVKHIYKFKITSGGKVVKTWSKFFILKQISNSILIIFLFKVLDLVNVKVYVGDDAAECTLTVEDEVMVALGSGKLTTAEALAQDKLDIDGDLALATLLAPFVQSL